MSATVEYKVSELCKRYYVIESCTQPSAVVTGTGSRQGIYITCITLSLVYGNTNQF